MLDSSARKALLVDSTLPRRARHSIYEYVQYNLLADQETKQVDPTARGEVSVCVRIRTVRATRISQ